MARLERKPVHVRKHKRKKPSGGTTTVRSHTRKQKVRVGSNSSGSDNSSSDPRSTKSQKWMEDIDKWEKTSDETWRHTSGNFSVYIDKQPAGWKVAGVRPNQPEAPEMVIENGISSEEKAREEAREFMKENDADWLGY